MTPDAMAALHAACFTTPRPWAAVEFQDILRDPLCVVMVESGGFLIGRVVADEAELLTLAVDPTLRRAGVATRLVNGFLATAKQRHATQMFLEVAANNLPAISLYTQAGFTENGRRKGYYHQPNAPALDALVLVRAL